MRPAWRSTSAHRICSSQPYAIRCWPKPVHCEQRRPPRRSAVRNVLTHHYWGAAWALIEEVLDEDLGQLRRCVEGIEVEGIEAPPTPEPVPRPTTPVAADRRSRPRQRRRVRGVGLVALGPFTAQDRSPCPPSSGELPSSVVPAVVVYRACFLRTRLPGAGVDHLSGGGDDRENLRWRVRLASAGPHSGSPLTAGRPSQRVAPHSGLLLILTAGCSRAFSWGAPHACLRASPGS